MAGKKKARGKIKYFVLFALGCTLFYWAYDTAWFPRSLQYAVAEQGNLNHETKTKATFANRETVLTAPIEGRVTYLCDDGQRLSKGEETMSILPGGVDYGVKLQAVTVNAPVTGLFSQECDGLEEIITPENLINMDLSRLLLEMNKSGQPQTENNSLIPVNSAVGKIIDNLSPSYAFIELPSIQGLALNQSINLTVDQEEHLSTIVRLSDHPVGIVVKCASFVNGSMRPRVREITVRTQKASDGTIVPLSALSTKGQTQGIYVEENGVVRFKEVEIIDQNETEVCVKGISAKTQVVVNPQEGIEGTLVR
ncbi:hypothetical protein Sgly_0659 [Syntrophobotulus glycolicus DSM 8271]|uniref:RND related barrel-sandwich hybrid domain-containing protein n=1 Tax=Syntrophobotulus glycolicus (strain DSM 8271 / FlGlyR) TaxID=645991 RepID=F0T010_SYNGF|nr:HlyD family efflux transporter periplasmic adaptor subunit [Syntrophobotulus glycolicus]ADY55021.1 hypothetical protein Sgly_0659 [Syntrophobotulus glycolicus DSM 8271]